MLKFADQIKLDGETYIKKRKMVMRKSAIYACVICIILGIGLGLAWSLASKRNHVNYCLQWNSATHKMERVVE